MLKTAVMSYVVNVPEVALMIDIYDSNTGTEAATVVFNMANHSNWCKP
jgi:hypothetical protein